MVQKHVSNDECDCPGRLCEYSARNGGENSVHRDGMRSNEWHWLRQPRIAMVQKAVMMSDTRARNQTAE